MDLALPDGEGEAFDDFLVSDGDVEVFDFDGGHEVSVKGKVKVRVRRKRNEGVREEVKVSVKVKGGFKARRGRGS
jgi:hypothetical protein